MRIYRGLPSYPSDAGPSVVALGAFDGVHLAHQGILEVAVNRGAARAARSIACTFDPHPLAVLRPEQAPSPIASLDDRLARFEALHIGVTVVLPFTIELAATEPEVFVKDVLVGHLQALEVVVGFNHTFGRGARGTPALLGVLGQELGFVRHVVPPLTVDGAVVSSSGIRELLRHGDVGRAGTLLGRPYAIGGRVVRGAGRGRQLGFPTANVATEWPPLVPPGVYAGQVVIDPSPLISVSGGTPGREEAISALEAQGVGSPEYPAVLNIGYRPTFGARELTVEVHLLDFDGDLYGRILRVDLHERIRDEQRFPDLEALREQIRRDVVAARTLDGPLRPGRPADRRD